jgi:hypothetical protein
MILYVNGDSHTAAAEAVNAHAFAEDDPVVKHLGRIPHPENLAVSWGKLLSKTLKATFHCDAESASSNARILRTTRAWLKNSNYSSAEILLIIQWSTWEREEWLHNGTYYQVGSSGIDHVPQDLQEKYRNYVIGTDWQTKTEQAHEDIWQFHLELNQQNIPHVFFNGNNNFSRITNKKNWEKNYIAPYDPSMTYDSILKNNDIYTVAPDSWHFGRDGHSYFHRFMLQYIIANKFI